ncbi:MAG: hypothetical protein WAS07_09415 [Micropruina sp.]
MDRDQERNHVAAYEPVVDVQFGRNGSDVGEREESRILGPRR